ncbi:ATP synthase F1 subunit epsilon [Fulvivirga sp. 29W222]|uniref:ATP synthase F1 subunit epsilon n=1 Tax=Fulvivirga marina TaxID=2494733 RepID=A0A937FVB1_9BACT|nr:ATP synthase F1 subunit epsilon [Fulvivirga marina]MBL6446800.1 ATP synthase F1 subunit epsilon [Fulvivirga marina]
MFLEIVTPAKKVYEGEVNAIAFPGVDGSFQVLNDHAPLVSSLGKGTVTYQNKEGKHNVEISGGVVEVLNNKIVLLADGLIGE